jgi:hypothetical protein
MDKSEQSLSRTSCCFHGAFARSAAQTRQIGQSGKTRFRQKAKTQNQDCREFCVASVRFRTENCGLCRRRVKGLPLWHPSRVLSNRLSCSDGRRWHAVSTEREVPPMECPRARLGRHETCGGRHSPVNATAAAESNRIFTKASPDSAAAPFDNRKREFQRSGEIPHHVQGNSGHVSPT